MTTTHMEEGKGAFTKEIDASDGGGDDETSPPSFSTTDQTYQFLLSYQEQNAGRLVMDPKYVYVYTPFRRSSNFVTGLPQQSSAIGSFHG